MHALLINFTKCVASYYNSVYIVNCNYSSYTLFFFSRDMIMMYHNYIVRILGNAPKYNGNFKSVTWTGLLAVREANTVIYSAKYHKINKRKTCN